MRPLGTAVPVILFGSMLACDPDVEPSGAPVPDTLVDNAYAVDLGTGSVVQPSWIGTLLLGQIDVEVLVGITSATDYDIDALLAVSDNGVDQDLCAQTFELPAPADFTGNPYVLFEIDHFDLEVGGALMGVDDFRLEGFFLSDGSALEDVVIAGTIDTKPLGFLVGGTGDSAVCDFVSPFGITCDPCPDGSGDYCLPLEIDDIEAPLLPGVLVEERTAADISADPACP